MKGMTLAAALFLAAAGSLAAQAIPLGLTLGEAFERFGVPEDVTVVRGDEPSQDDVVFRYRDGLSLFWYRGRVWQVRFDSGYPGSIRGISMGASRSEIAAVLGKPFYAEDDWMLYHFAGNGYPIRLRLFFSGEGLHDAYLYRGDY